MKYFLLVSSVVIAAANASGVVPSISSYMTFLVLAKVLSATILETTVIPVNATRSSPKGISLAFSAYRMASNLAIVSTMSILPESLMSDKNFWSACRAA